MDKAKIPRRDSEQTRRHLLSAGSEIFAAKGYRDTTIAEICEKAGANIAAINYHFKDKETLYIESWHHSFLKSIETHPPDGGVDEGAPPEERLKGQMTALLKRIADRDNKEFIIVVKEFANPTGLLKRVMREDMRPVHTRMEVVVRELLGKKAPDTDVQFCVLSIITQCVNGVVAGIAEDLGWDDEDCPPKIEDMEAYADHVVTFSLAGIAAIRDKKRKKR